MHQRSAQKNASQTQESEKVPFVVAKKIRDGILDEVFKPGDRLTEAELVEKFNVSRSPVREALLALEKEGTVIISPFKGAMVKPLSPAEVLDIAELRLALISLPLNQRIVILLRRTSTMSMTWQSDLHVPTASKSTLNTIDFFGTPFLPRPNGRSCAKCSGNWRPRHSV